MNYEITKAKKGDVVEFKTPSSALYDELGRDGMQKLMYRFYDEIYNSDIAHFFPQDPHEFEKVKEKNTEFFIQICGGPSTYDEHVRELNLNDYMIQLHKKFSIYEKSRYEWLGIFRDQLKDLDISQKIKDEFWDYLDNFSKMMVNRYTDKSAYV